MRWIKDLFNYWQLHGLSKRGILEQVDQELRILRHDFKVALRYLKGNYRKRLNFYNRLPLYLVIGPSTFGKTTLLANSGLELRNVHNQSLQQIMSTKYCVWWFSKEAVCLDTAGIYTESDAGELRNNLVWRGFLKLLKSYRASNPIAGLIVVLDLPVLAEDSSKRQKVVDGIRERIYEVAHYMNKLPIFIVFTKCDLVEGFSEFFADLKDDERAQPFGITFTDGEIADPVQMFTGQFNDLLRRLNKKVVRRLQQEKDGEKKKQIKDFPLQLDALRPVIAELINGIPISAHLALFGVYFTSSVQRGVPYDYLSNPIQEKVGAAVKKNGKVLHGDRSYFIENLFKQIVFVPKLWNGTARLSSKKKWYNFIIVVMVVGLIGLGYELLSYSYEKNVGVISSVNNVLRDYKPYRLERDNLNKLQLAVARLSQARQTWWSHLGFNETRQLNDLLRKVYYNAVVSTFVPQLQKTLETEMVTAAAAEPQKLYNVLKVYLMLGQPDKLDEQYVRDWFGNYWGKTLANAPEKQAEFKEKLAAILTYRIKIKTDAQIIATARSTLNADSAPTVKAAYENLLRKYQGQELIFALTNERKLSISKMYTRDSFDQVLKEQIPSIVHTTNIQGTDWVLGTGITSVLPAAGSTNVVNELQSLYFENYVNAWMNLLQSVKLDQVSDLQAARQLLISLLDGDIQLLALLKAAQVNIAITDAPANFTQLANAKLGWLKEVDVVALRTSISNVINYFSSIFASDNANQAAFAATVARFQGGKQDALSGLYALAAKQPEVVRGWLQNIADDCWRALLETTHQYIGAAWVTTVLPSYQQSIDNSYPIFKGSKRSISIEDFTKFFGVKGTMDKFFDSYLRPFVDTAQMYWVWKNVDGQTLNVPQEVLEVFIRAALIQKMFYADDKSALGARFSLKPLEMSPNAKLFILDLEGQKINYEYGQKKIDHLVWPGPTPNAVTVEFLTAAGSHVNTIQSDPWAWFRLLDKSNLHVIEGTNRFGLTFDLNGNAIRYELAPEREVNPFIQNITGSFHCPEKI